MDNSPQKQSKPDSKPVATVDHEVWVRDRIRSAIRTVTAIRESKRVGADERIVEDAVDGAVNGAALEIFNHLGMKVEGKNLKLSNGRDDHLLVEVPDDE